MVLFDVEMQQSPPPWALKPLINGLPCLEGVSPLFVGASPAPRQINNSMPGLHGALGMCGC